MELIPIFVDETTWAGLYSVRYSAGAPDEYERLFDLWSDVEYIASYLKENKGYLGVPFFKGKSIGDLTIQILDESYWLQQQLDDYTEAGFAAKGNKLEMLFRPIGKQMTISVHQETKARLKHDRYFPKPLLRLYALRLGPNTFVVTGGAVKLVHQMKDHPDTAEELEKLNEVRNYLRKLGIQNDDDLIYYYEQSERTITGKNQQQTFGLEKKGPGEVKPSLAERVFGADRPARPCGNRRSA